VREKNFYNAEHPRKVELSDDFYRKAVLLAKERGKEIGIAIDQQEKIDFFQELGVIFWKSLSWDLKNYELQRVLQQTGKDVFVSNGMSSMREIVEMSRDFDNVTFIHTQLNYELESVNL
jgi:sialic acid synthase SpsE